MKLMKTAEEMYMYCVKYNTGTGNAVKWSLGHFKVVEKCLEDDEYAMVAFMAAHYTSEQQPELQYGNVITNKRLIMGQQRTFEHRLKVVPLNELNNIIMTENNGTANIFIDTVKNQIRMSIYQGEGEHLKKIFIEILEQVRLKRAGTHADARIIEEIREYKQLMDERALTEEEFAEKKRQLLSAEGKDNSPQEITLDIDISNYNPEKAEEVKEEFAVEKEEREYRNGRWGRIIIRICGVIVLIGIASLLFNPLE